MPSPTIGCGGIMLSAHPPISLAISLLSTSRDPVSLWLVGGGDFNETRHKYSCVWALLKRFSGSQVKVVTDPLTYNRRTHISMVWHRVSLLFYTVPVWIFIVERKLLMSTEFLIDCLMLMLTARVGAWCVGTTESECSRGGERCASVNFL